MQDSSAQSEAWCRADLVVLLSLYSFEGKEGVEKSKVTFDGLIDQDTLFVKSEHFNLVFEHDAEDGASTLTEDEMVVLVGPSWRSEKELYLQRKKTGPKVLGRGFQSTLNDLDAQYCLPRFNIMSQGKGILVPSFNGSQTTEAPPIVNLAISLTETACLSSDNRGMFLWQRKERAKPGSEVRWHTIPDLLLLDHRWRESASSSFLQASYESKRDYLNADLRLKSNDIVLPISVDFPGACQNNQEAAYVSAHLDAEHPPLAAISIPGAAYIGWVRDMVLHSRGDPSFRKRCVETGEGGLQYRVPGDNLADFLVERLVDMRQKALLMYDNPVDRAVVFYSVILHALKAIEMSTSIVQKISDVDPVD